MLTFFRRIRKGLLDMGATRKYLLYAVGEILLVMIGILLALQVNNWNQDRINKNSEKNFLERFLADFRTDSLCIEHNQYQVDLKIEGLNLLDRLLYDNSRCCKDSIKNAIENSTSLGWAIIENRSKATISEIISSGKLTLISNEDVRLEIIQYYAFWDHTYDRSLQRRSDFPNFTYEIFGLKTGEDSADWFYSTLKENDALLEFKRKFNHERRYGYYLKHEMLPELRERLNYVNDLVTQELNRRS